MAAELLDGTAIAERIKAQLREELARLRVKPRLGVVYFETPASQKFLNAQLAQSRELGIDLVTDASRQGLSPNATQRDVIQLINRWNEDPSVHGIFVHQPLPSGIDAQQVSAVINPSKDVEGIHPQNSARRFFAKARIGSCTALAVMELIESTGIELAGKEAVVVGHSEIVGRPVSMLLLDRMATTTVCHVETDRAGRLEDHVRRADILVVAIGKPAFIQGAWIKPRSIVIDVGINVVGGRVVGDVEFEAARQRAAFISPVPGGVGPVTVMMVMKNTLEAFKLQR